MRISYTVASAMLMSSHVSATSIQRSPIVKVQAKSVVDKVDKSSVKRKKKTWLTWHQTIALSKRNLVFALIYCPICSFAALWTIALILIESEKLNLVANVEYTKKSELQIKGLIDTKLAT